MQGPTTVSQATVDDVRSELRDLDSRETSPLRKLLILAVTLALFVSWGLLSSDPREVAMLVAVVIFHELGHFLAMKVFGYRNVSMFFVPFVGAAVSGESRRVPAWKATLVALAGPAPGILLGLVVLIVWLSGAAPGLAYEAAAMLILLNAFNLLPLLPLDGGHVLRILLARQHVWLEVTFTVVTGAALGLLGLGVGSWVLMGIGAVVLLSSSAVLSSARLAQSFQETLGLDHPSRNKDLIELDDDTLELLITRLRATVTPSQPLRTGVQLLHNGWDRYGVDPAGCLPTVILLGVHGGLVMVSLIAAIVLGVQKLPVPVSERFESLQSEAESLRQDGRFPEAADKYKAALAIWTRHREPSEPRAIKLTVWLTECLRESGELDEAIATARAALALDSRDRASKGRVFLRWELALSLEKKGRQAEFLKEGRRALEQSKRVLVDFYGDIPDLQKRIRSRLPAPDPQPEPPGPKSPKGFKVPRYGKPPDDPDSSGADTTPAGTPAPPKPKSTPKSHSRPKSRPKSNLDASPAPKAPSKPAPKPARTDRAEDAPAD